MEIVIDVPKTDEEIEQEMKEQTAEFKKMGLLPIEESEE